MSAHDVTQHSQYGRIEIELKMLEMGNVKSTVVECLGFCCKKRLPDVLEERQWIRYRQKVHLLGL